MKNYASTRIIIPHKPLPLLKRMNWVLPLATVLSGLVVWFIIWCATKAVRP